MQCRICSHDSRAAIELACKTRELAAVAEKFEVSEKGLERHMAKHPRARGAAAKSARAAASSLPKTTRRAPPVRPAVAARPTMPSPAPIAPLPEIDESPITSRSPRSLPTARAKVDELLVSLKRIADSIDGESSVTDRVAVLRAAVQPIRLLGQLTGELGANETTVATSPHYRRIRNAIVEALRAHPDALRDVIDALEREERGGSTHTADAAAE